MKYRSRTSGRFTRLFASTIAAGVVQTTELEKGDDAGSTSKGSTAPRELEDRT